MLIFSPISVPFSNFMRSHRPTLLHPKRVSMLQKWQIYVVSDYSEILLLLHSDPLNQVVGFPADKSVSKTETQEVNQSSAPSGHE
jgi:hypothetical protein